MLLSTILLALLSHCSHRPTFPFPSLQRPTSMKSKMYTFDGERLTVTWDGKRCIHVEACVHGLPSVFDPKRRPWIEPENAQADPLAEVIEKCPTGALQYTRHDGGPDETSPERNGITIAADGPLYLHGDITIVNTDGEEILRDTRVALCRCGRSSNKPLCDNSHLEGFEDAGSLGTSGALTEDEPSSGAPLRVTARKDGPFVIEGPVMVTAADGTASYASKLALCRCGASKNKPFCDGTHKAIGFTAD